MRCVVDSAFRRFGLKEKDGTDIELTSHTFRHWVVTQLVDGGAPDALIMRWQGRSHEGDISAYKHVLRDERVQQALQAIREGFAVGEKSDLYEALVAVVEDADDFINSQIGHVHVTDMGLCVHDFGASPCPYNVQCLRGCEDYVVDTRDEYHLSVIRQFIDRTQSILEREMRMAEEEGWQVSRQWVESNEESIENGRKILEAASENEGVVQPFSGQGSNFIPFDDSDFIPLEDVDDLLDDIGLGEDDLGGEDPDSRMTTE
jgi:hypothetical protein